MLEEVNAKLIVSERAHRRNWEAIERCLDLAAKAESLRERSRKLREASRLLRQESARISCESSLQQTLLDLNH